MIPRRTIEAFDLHLAALGLRLDAVVIGGSALALLDVKITDVMNALQTVDELIGTVRNVGYRFEPQRTDEATRATLEEDPAETQLGRELPRRR